VRLPNQRPQGPDDDYICQIRLINAQIRCCYRVIQVVSRNRGETASRIITALYEAVLRFSGRAKLDDDITIVVIKVKHGD
jgi:hypothetical protein